MFTHLYELLRARAAAGPNTIVVGGQERLIWKTLSGRELLDLVDLLSEELRALGVAEGDRVVLWAPNHWRTPVYLFAIWKLGAVVVPFDREMNPEGGARILTSVEPRCIVVGYGEHPAWAGEWKLTEWWEPGSRGGVSPTSAWTRPAEELAALMFTSGTTGLPKGCMITHANFCSQAEAVPRRVPLGPDCRLASVLPLSHLLELTGLIYVIASGAAVHYVPSRRGPDIVRVLSEQRITHMVVVPQLLRMMGRAVEDELAARLPAPIWKAIYALGPRLPLAARRWLFWPLHHKLGGHLRLMLSGGAALPDETHLLWERFGVRISQGYGTSECSPVVTLGNPDGKTPLGSVGRPIEGVEVKLSPEGELLVHGPNVMRGYWKDPIRTAEVLRDGWYATGDAATIDDAGYMRIVGRVKDLIALPSGLKVWPEDVEEVLRAHPAVKDAAIAALPTAAGGTVLHAYLLPADGAGRETDLGTIVAECNGRLAIHQRLASASWYPASDFPRTSTLKVRRHLLTRPEGAETVKIESVLAADDPVGQAVAGVAEVAKVGSEQTLSQLGLDSLGLVELATALEVKTGKAVADGDLRLEMTVEQVRTLLAAAPDLEGVQQTLRTSSPEVVSTDLPRWPYTWGRVFRVLAFPIDLLYRYAVTQTILLGREHLADLPPRVIFAGTHHGFPDMPLVRSALAKSGARLLLRRLVVAIAAVGMGSGGHGFGTHLGLYPWYGVLALGLYPLRQYSERDASLRGLARLAADHPVLIFPQGAHIRPEQERAGEPVARFRPGVAYLAATIQAAVVPFGVAGTESMMPPQAGEFRGRLIAGIPVSIKRGPLAIAFGPPLRPEPGESTQAFTARLEKPCFALTRQAEESLRQEDKSTLAAA